MVGPTEQKLMLAGMSSTITYIVITFVDKCKISTWKQILIHIVSLAFQLTLWHFVCVIFFGET